MISAGLFLTTFWKPIVVAIFVGVLFSLYQAQLGTAFKAGEAQERGLWMLVVAKNKVDADAVWVLHLQAAREKEQESARTEAKMVDTFLKRETYEKQKSDAIIADLRSGARVMRDPGGVPTNRGADCDTPPDTAPSPFGSDAGRGFELSRQASGFLFSEAQRADEVVRRLGLSQDYIRGLHHFCSTQ